MSRELKHTFDDIEGYIDIDTLEKIYGRCFNELEIRKLQYWSKEIFPEFDSNEIRWKIEDWLMEGETIVNQIDKVLNKNGFSIHDFMNVYHPKSVK